MVKMEAHSQSNSSLPLLSKPDRMDSFVSLISALLLILKHITRHPNLSRWRYIFSFGRKNNECGPLNSTVADGNNKSYLLDRIESLEDRLIQLSLEIESRRTSRNWRATSTLSGAREVPVSSYPVFNNSKAKCKRDVLPISTGGDLQERGDGKKQKRRKGNNGNGEDDNNDKAFRKGKKKAHSWPHMKMLGC